MCELNMNANWTNELELQFLQHYQAEPMIWNTKHLNYKDKLKKNEAWDRISHTMNIPVADLKRKRDSLLSSFRKYRKIIKDSMDAGAGGEVYKPIWFAYDYMHSFLGDGTSLPKMTFNPVAKKEPESPAEEDQDKLGDNDDETFIFYEPGQEGSAQPSPQTKRKRRDPPELEEARSYIRQAVNTLNLALKNYESQEDECDLYGRIVAGRLRRLPYEERLQMMHDIDGIFLRRQSAAAQALQGPHVSRTPSPVGSHALYIRPNSANSS